MYPFIIFGNIRVYIFGVFIVLAWIVFFYCLHYFSRGKGISKPIFGDILSFTLSIFFFSRLFYILSQWRDSKFIFQDFLSGNSGIIDFLYTLFISHDYNLSLFGGVVGFFIVFFLKAQKGTKRKYLDIILPSFLIAGIIAYIGAIFGGQVYGIRFDSFISLNYDTKYSEVPFRTLLFPLPIFYVIGFLILLFIWKKLSKLHTPDGYVGFVLLGLFGFLLFMAEFFSGSSDIFDIYIRLNHLLGIICIFSSIIGISKFLRS